MNILTLFFAGLLAGLIVSQIQKTDVQSPNSDIALGMTGALIMGSLIAQYTELSPIILLMSIVGAVVFVEVGRSIPQAH